VSRPVRVIAHSAYGEERARLLLGHRRDVEVVAAARSVRRALGDVRAWRGARVLYLVDVGRTTALLAALGRVLGRRVVVDTGDVGFELARATGSRGRAGLALIWAGEQVALRAAHHVVVRGREHARHLPARRPTTHVPDVAPAQARPTSGAPVREALGIAPDAFVVGLVGSLVHAPRRGISYGWDLVEALALTPPAVTGLVVGDGDALDRLRRRARELGVDGRCAFAGRVPAADVAGYIGAMDVALSTQSNDAIGAVRTTGKLPLYLACGCPVLASDVGEARRLLGPLGWTLRYDGAVDRAYPQRLAAAVARWSASPGEAAARREQALRLSREAFAPEAQRERLDRVVDALL
jgi:glycosyltransferase involved in cell wall biosynthesis